MGSWLLIAAMAAGLAALWAVVDELHRIRWALERIAELWKEEEK